MIPLLGSHTCGTLAPARFASCVGYRMRKKRAKKEEIFAIMINSFILLKIPLNIMIKGISSFLPFLRSFCSPHRRQSERSERAAGVGHRQRYHLTGVPVPLFFAHFY